MGHSTVLASCDVACCLSRAGRHWCRVSHLTLTCLPDLINLLVYSMYSITTLTYAPNMCVQPLRDSLQMHSRLGSAAASARLLASIAHPPASDRPGPLEAGHRRARSLILTPIEFKVLSSKTQYPATLALM